MSPIGDILQNDLVKMPAVMEKLDRQSGTILETPLVVESTARPCPPPIISQGIPSVLLEVRVIPTRVGAS